MAAEVGATGPLNAKIYVVGEAPGRTEIVRGLPFVGPSGSLLWDNLLNRGIRREECRVNNVIHHELKGNLWKNATAQEVADGKADLLLDILACRPSVVLSLGGGVLTTLTGNHGIDHWRGSVLQLEHNGFRCNILPTFHPARLLRTPKIGILFYFDLGKLRELTNGILKEPTPTHIQLHPTMADVQAYCHFLQEQSRFALDIETYPDLDLRLSTAKCIAFAHSASEGMCIPLTKEYWGSNIESVWEVVKETLESEKAEKEGQNGQFDLAVLSTRHGIEVKNYAFDTMCAQHVAYPELPKSLAVLCSIYTDRPYYKFMRGASDSETLWQYNAIDALVTFEAATNLRSELREMKLLDFYKQRVHPTIPLMMELQRNGIRVDMVQMLKLKMRERLHFAEAQVKLWEAAGWPVNANSSIQLKKLLYTELGFQPVYKHGVVTLDKLALKKLKAKYAGHPVFDLVLEYRRSLKQDSTYLNFQNVRQGRMHTSYNLGGRVEDEWTGKAKSAPETGRVSSSRSIVYFSGTNLQNITRGALRTMFLPEPEEVLLEADLSQAEARVVAYESNETTMIQIFESGGDIHMLNSEVIAAVAPDVFKERFGSDLKRLRNEFTKNHVHAFNYGEGPWMFAERAGVTRQIGERIRNAYFTKYSGLTRWHKNVETALRSGLREWNLPVRTLRNLFGRQRIFYGRLDEGTMREAYAYVPQSTVGDLLNIQFLATWKISHERAIPARPVLQVHDSQVWSVRRDVLPTLASIIIEQSKIEMTSSDGLRKFMIPVELKVGENWGEMKEYKLEVESVKPTL